MELHPLSVCKKYRITAVLEVINKLLTCYHFEETTQLDIIEAQLTAINKNILEWLTNTTLVKSRRNLKVKQK